MHFITIFTLLFCITINTAIEMDREMEFDCPDNEQYVKCKLEVCFKSCKDLRTPTPCPSIAPGCFMPACVCKETWLRNNAGVCVPYQECDGQVIQTN